MARKAARTTRRTSRARKTARKKTTRRKASRKKAGRKKTARKKATRRKAAPRKKATRRKAARKKTAPRKKARAKTTRKKAAGRKKAGRKTTARKKAPAKKKAAKKSAARKSTTPTAEAVARKIIKFTTNRGKMKMSDIYAANAVSHEQGGGPPTEGLAALEGKLQGWEGNLSSESWKAKNVWVKGNTIGIEWDANLRTKRGTSASFSEVAVHEIKGGKIVSERYYYDPAGMAPIVAEMMGGGAPSASLPAPAPPHEIVARAPPTPKPAAAPAPPPVASRPPEPRPSISPAPAAADEDDGDDDPEVDPLDL
jgi:hypothetical protein